MMKKLGNTLIKVLSLGVGLAIGMVLIAKVCFELSYDRMYDDADRIYEIRSVWERHGQSDVDPSGIYNISGAVAPGFQEEVPGVVEATRFSVPFSGDKYVDADKNIIVSDYPVLAVDTNFFKIFNRQILVGDPTEILSSYDGRLLVSESFAEKLGGVEQAVGKVIANEDYLSMQLTVAGVFEDFPENSSVKADVVTAIHIFGDRSITNWLGNDRYHGYVKLAEGVEPASLEDAIHKMQETHQSLEDLEQAGLKLWYTLFPFQKQHISSEGVRSQVATLSIIAFLLIFISILNYILVAISDVIRRSREVGVRKCYGADGANIYKLLIGETGLNLFISLAIAVLLIFSFRGTVETLTDVSVSAMMIPQTIIVLVTTVIVIFAVSAVIPAQMFIRVPVSTAFRGYKENKRKWKLSLLTFQFIINVLLLILVMVASVQYNKVIREDVGYNPDNLLYVPTHTLSTDKSKAIMEKVRTLSFVEGAELTFQLPFNGVSGNNVYLPGDVRELFNIADTYGATEGYLEMMGIEILEGKAPAGPKDVAVSRSFVERMMQFADWSDGAVGKEIRVSEHSQTENDFFTVCGVFEDYRVSNAFRPDSRPIVLFHEAFDMLFNLVIRVNEVSAANMDALRAVLAEHSDALELEIISYEESMISAYKPLQKTKNTFILGAMVAILIALFGLIGFINDETERRSAEIAIRKVNGAQTHEIIRMFIINILKLAGIAIIIGNIAAWFVAQKWLEQFAERVDLGPWYFIAADAAMLIIIIATVVFGSIRVARMNPTISLKKD